MLDGDAALWQGDDMILTDRNGRPIPKPVRADFDDEVAFLRAWWAYKDRIASEANAAFAEAFNREMRKSRRGELLATLAATLIASAATPVPASTRPPATPLCLGSAPLCHVGQHPMCLCTGPSRTTCGWVCMQSM